MEPSNMQINERGHIKKIFNSVNMKHALSDDDGNGTTTKEVIQMPAVQPSNLDDEIVGPPQVLGPIGPVVHKETILTSGSNFDLESDREKGPEKPVQSHELNISKEYNQLENKCPDTEETVSPPNNITETGEMPNKFDDIGALKPYEYKYQVREPSKYEEKFHKIQTPPHQKKDETCKEKKEIAKKTKCADNDETAAGPTDGQEPRACNTERDPPDVVSLDELGIPIKTATVHVHSAAIEENSSVQTTAVIDVTVLTATVTEQVSAQATAAQDQVSFQTAIVTEDVSIQTVTDVDDVSVHTAAVTKQVSAQATAAQDQVSFQTAIVTEDVSNQTVTDVDDVSIYSAAVTEQVSEQATVAVGQVSFQIAVVTEDVSIPTATTIHDVSVRTAAVTEQVSAQAAAIVHQVSFQAVAGIENVSTQTATNTDSVSMQIASVVHQVSVQTSAIVHQVSFQTAAAIEDASTQTATHIDDVSVQTATVTVIEDVNVEVADVTEQPHTCQRSDLNGLTEAKPENVQQCSQTPERVGPHSYPSPCIQARNTGSLAQTPQTIQAGQQARHEEPTASARALSVETIGHQTATPRHPEIQTSEEILQLRGPVTVHSTRLEQSYPNNNLIWSHVPGIRVRRGTPVHTAPCPGVRLRHVWPRGSVVVNSTCPDQNVEYNHCVVDLQSLAVDWQETQDHPEDRAADVDVRQPGPRQTDLPQAVRGASELRIQNQEQMISDMSADERGRLPSQLRNLLDHELMATLSHDLGSRRGPVVVTCVVCSSRPVSVLTFNCTHRVVCIVCFLQRRLRRCPLLWCQRPILFYWHSGSQ